MGAKAEQLYKHKRHVTRDTHSLKAASYCTEKQENTITLYKKKANLLPSKKLLWKLIKK